MVGLAFSSAETIGSTLEASARAVIGFWICQVFRVRVGADDDQRGPVGRSNSTRVDLVGLHARRRRTRA